MSELLIEKATKSFSDRIYYRPLIPLLIAFISGIAAADQLPEKLFWPAISGILISAGMLIYAIGSHKAVKLFPLILFFCLGYYALTPWQADSLSQDHIAFYVNDSEKWEITGIIDDPPVFQGYRTICILDHIRLSRPGNNNSPVAVKGKIRAIIYEKTGPLDIGDRLTFTAKIRPFTNFKNPGAFDYIKYMSFKQIWGNAYSAYKKVSIVPSANTVQKHLYSVRKNISDIIDQSSGNDANAILKALILGNRQEISKPLVSAFNRAGISHILAISGLHIGIVASFAFFLFTRLFSRFNIFLQNAWTRKWAAVFSLIPIISYGTIAGMSPSTQRAVIMVGVFLLTFLLEREHDLINTVSAAALIILVICPPALFSISFQLSFAAVLAIIYGISKIQPAKKQAFSMPAYLMKTIVSFCIVSGLAIIGTAGLTMYYFNQISLMGIFSNLIFIPLIGFAVVPLGLFSVLILMPFSSGAACWGLKFCDMILTFAIQWIFKISNLSYAAFKTITPSFIEIICTYALLGSVLYLLFPDSKQNKNHQPRDQCISHKVITNKSRLSRSSAAKKTFSKQSPFSYLKIWFTAFSARKWMVIIAVISFLVLCADISYWVIKRWGKKDLTVSIIDAGQGNAALIEMPGGQCALIDGGGYSNNAIFDIGKTVIAPFLWHKKIKTIETVFLTHYDADHLNGLIYILKHFNVKQVFANHDPGTCYKNKEFNQIISDQKIDYPLYDQFPKKFRKNDVMFNILYPLEEFSNLINKDTWRDSNNNSMVIKINYENQSILFPGDIMCKAEKELIGLHHDLQTTVLVSPHHGSSTSSTPAFLRQVNPEYIIISSGKQNRFGFPAPEVLARYNKMKKIRIYRTDINGCISISINGDNLSIEPLQD